jgi:uncharacterized protein (TIGR00661 family)
MLFSQNNENNTTRTILVAPLDWGLGHAARCIPIIKELQNYRLRIIIAADGAVKTMLKQEFPQLQFIDLEGYKIKYSKNKRWFRFKLLIQFPKILSSVTKEHRWLNKVIKEHSVDAVISDNRFGLYHQSIPCVYLTHQLFIKTGNSISDLIATKIHKKYIKNYTQCWIPDYEGKKNIAGALSQAAKGLQSLRYIGCLSRFEVMSASENTVDLLIVLSGPEPQRSIFEKLLLDQLKEYKGKVLFVRGLPGVMEQYQTKDHELSPGLIVKNHLDARQLNQAMQSASLIISRSGYTTIMDLLKLGRKALLVPTPGQTEQEYLAGYLSAQQYFCTVSQDRFVLKDAIALSSEFQYQLPSFDMEQYKKIIQEFVEML